MLKLIWVRILLSINNGVVMNKWLCIFFCLMLKYLVMIRWFEWNVVLLDVIGRIIMLRKVSMLLIIFKRLNDEV